MLIQSLATHPPLSSNHVEQGLDSIVHPMLICNVPQSNTAGGLSMWSTEGADLIVLVALRVVLVLQQGPLRRCHNDDCSPDIRVAETICRLLSEYWC